MGYPEAVKFETRHDTCGEVAFSCSSSLRSTQLATSRRRVSEFAKSLKIYYLNYLIMTRKVLCYIIEIFKIFFYIRSKNTVNQAMIGED